MPFGVLAALYLREYAKPGRARPSRPDRGEQSCRCARRSSSASSVWGSSCTRRRIHRRAFYPERLPTPTFGTGGILWASLTLALLTVPVVIVASEEALAAVPRSMREASLATGATKFQTIMRMVLPRQRRAS